MTWTLNYESGPADYTTHSFSDSNPVIAFWYYFFDTFLPTKGWTTVSGEHNINQTYFLCKKEVTQSDGTLLKWCVIYEFEWATYDLVMYSMPWSTNTPDITNLIDVYSLSSDWQGWRQDEGGRVQVWESDQDNTCFFVKNRDPGMRALFALALPDSWFYAKPNVVSGYDTSHFHSFLFDGSLKLFHGDKPNDNAQIMYSSYPPYYTQEMRDTDYLSTYIQLGMTGNYNIAAGSQNDMLWHNPGYRTWDIEDWQAIGYKGKNYVDTGYGFSNKGIMFDVGQVDPQTGV